MNLDGVEVALTNLDRVMFPDSGITKREVVEYYRDVAHVMLPELRGRPLSVERYTKGVDKGGFFQKHWQKHYPSWLDHVEIHGKTVVDYPIVNTQAALVNRRRHPTLPQTRQRAGIDGVAAELVARKGGAIEQPHTHTSAREDRGRHRASGSRTDDQDIIHGKYKVRSTKYKVSAKCPRASTEDGL